MGSIFIDARIEIWDIPFQSFEPVFLFTEGTRAFWKVIARRKWCVLSLYHTYPFNGPLITPIGLNFTSKGCYFWEYVVSWLSYHPARVTLRNSWKHHVALQIHYRDTFHPRISFSYQKKLLWEIIFTRFVAGGGFQPLPQYWTSVQFFCA